MTDPRASVAVELAALQTAGWADRGVGRYATNYTAALDRAGAVAAGLLDPDRPPPFALPPGLVFSGQVDWDGARACRRLAAAGLWYQVTAPFLGFETDPDPIEPGPWERAGVPRAAILYDLIPLRAPRYYLAAPGAEARYRRRADWIAASDLLFAISDFTRHEAIEALGCDPDRVVTVGVGVSEFFSAPDGTDEGRWKPIQKQIGDRPFLMTVTGSDVRKGGDRAVVALGRLVERGYDLSIVVVGHLTAEWTQHINEAAAAAGVSDRVHLLGGVEDDLLRAVYRRAELNVMPSLAEGLGLPVLESAACGTASVASDSTALGETAGTALATFDPADVNSIADAVAAVLDSPGRRARVLAVQQEAARQATWDSVAAKALAAMSASSTGDRPEPPPPRVALIGRRPIGGDIPARIDIDRFEDAGGVRLSAYDDVVYVLGEGDGSVREVAGRHAGWLWPEGPAVPLEPLVRRSTGIVVRSESDWETVRLGLDPMAADPPVVFIGADGGSFERLTGDPAGTGR